MFRAAAAMIVAAILSVPAPAGADNVDARAREIFRQDGYREFCPFGHPHCNTFVPVDLPQLTMAWDQLANITVSAMIRFARSVHAPPLKSGSEYVEVLWVQRGPESIKAVIEDSATGTSFTAYSCKFDGYFYFCDFMMPRTALTHPATVKFVTPHQAPGVLPGRSIAWLAYQTFADQVRSLSRGGMPVGPNALAGETYKNLARLHALDPEIPNTL